MALFMIKTAYYDTVTKLEAEKIAESEAKREAFLDSIKTPERK